MRLHNIQNNKGFTLLELLVVIAIIGILSAVVLAAMADSRLKARNTAVVSEMFEYQKTLELQYSDTGTYPATNVSRRARFCFGDGLVNGDDCMGSMTSTYIAANPAYTNINDAFLAYISSIPRFAQARGSFNYSSPAYSGCTGAGTANTSCTVSDYSIWFLLEKTNQNCGRATVANSSLSGEYTVCRLQNKSY